MGWYFSYPEWRKNLQVILDINLTHPFSGYVLRSISTWLSLSWKYPAWSWYQYLSLNLSLLVVHFDRLIAQTNRIMRRYKYSNWQWHLDDLRVKIKTSGARNHVDSFNRTRTDECARAMLKGYERRKTDINHLMQPKQKWMKNEKIGLRRCKNK